VGKSGVIIHTFDTSDDWASRRGNEDWVLRAYLYWFPWNAEDGLCTAEIVTDAARNRSGIDRELTFDSGMSIGVEEKYRRHNFGDLLLERWADEARQVPGWADRDLQCAFLAVFFADDHDGILLPWRPIRNAWRRHRDEWWSLGEAK
jgi:GNAT superfamily N-acetyltransferase